MTEIANLIRRIVDDGGTIEAHGDDWARFFCDDECGIPVYVQFVPNDSWYVFSDGMTNEFSTMTDLIDAIVGTSETTR